MTLLRRFLAAIAVLGLLALVSACGLGDGKANAPLSKAALQRLADIGSSPGATMMVRIFKQSSELEVWKLATDGRFKLFNTYKICAWSGDLGPKIVEGDRQAPEGFYTITPGLMNPKSSYYLSFNTGFPNKFDRAYGRTGNALMVHGDCSSAGCYAMTDPQIAEIYALARESFRGGNRSFELEIFPFRLTAANLAKVSGNPNLPFWKNLKQGYDRFETARIPPSWDVCEKRYVFDTTGPDGKPLDPLGPCPVGPHGGGVTTAAAAPSTADVAANAALASALPPDPATKPDRA